MIWQATALWLQESLILNNSTGSYINDKKEGYGPLEKYEVEMIGATPEIIQSAEERETFNRILQKVGAKHTKSRMVREFKQGLQVAEEILLQRQMPNLRVTG